MKEGMVSWFFLRMCLFINGVTGFCFQLALGRHDWHQNGFFMQKAVQKIIESKEVFLAMKRNKARQSFIRILFELGT